MPRLLWLHSDGGLLIVVLDYVLTEDVECRPRPFLFFFFLHRRGLARPGSYIHSPESQTNLFLSKVSVGKQSPVTLKVRW